MTVAMHLPRREAGRPPLSVVMSCLDAERWLVEAIDSVLAQTFTDFEVVVIDDGSQDGTWEIIAAYQVTDPRVQAVRKANTGLADSLNLGISLAQGSWIARLDADDKWLPRKLELQVKALDSTATTLLMGTATGLIDSESHRTGTVRYPRSSVRLVTRLRRAMAFPAHSSAVFSRQAAQRVGLYRPRIRRAQDRDLWLRLSRLGEVGCLDDALTLVRKHANQVSHESGGTRQFVDSRVAITAYWVHSMSGLDPVDADDEVFGRFRAFVSERLQEEQAIAMYRDRRRIAGALRSSVRDQKWPRSEWGVLGQAPIALPRLVSQRMFGDALPERIAREWVQLEVGVSGVDS